MGKTNIEWTDRSWPVVNGCRRVSAGCEHCYAERLTATRLRHLPKYAGLAAMRSGGPRWSGATRLWLPALAEPLHVRKPCRWFVADMGDLFYAGVSFEDIAAVFGVMAACPRHTFQVLTKRPERTLDWLAWYAEESGAGAVTADAALHAGFARLGGHFPTHPSTIMLFAQPWPLPNVHLGVSVEDQATADERIPLLLDCPAALRWVSAEPLLGPVELSCWMGAAGAVTTGVQWVVVGSESGPGARPMDIAWARSLVEQCRAADVPCFVKQVRTADGDAAGDRKGSRTGYWPEDLRVREWP